MEYALWLVSWYPNRTDRFNGDFIERHAKAVSLFTNIILINITKDEDQATALEIVTSKENNLLNIQAYYKKSFVSGWIEKILSLNKYKSIQKKIIKDVIKKYGEPKIVHVHIAMKAGLGAVYLKKENNISFIVSEHWSGYYSQSVQNIYAKGLLFKKLNRDILKNASLVLPVAKSLEKAINNFEKINSEVVPNVVDTNLFFYKNVSPDKFRFIHVSSMNHIKNPEGIIRAVKTLADENVQFELIMAGKKDYKLKEMAACFDLYNKYIFFKDEMTYREVAIEMQQSCALLMFSIYESLPCVILEALCCGLPVISSNVGSISEIINQLNGILVESENEQQLKEAMKKMITNYNFYNRKLIEDDAVHKFSYEVVGKQISSIYDQLETHKIN